MTLDRFCALEHVLVSYEGDGFRGVTDSALEKIGRTRHVGLSVSHFLVLPDVLALSDMIAVVPSRIAENQTGMFICETPVPVPRLYQEHGLGTAERTAIPRRRGCAGCCYKPVSGPEAP